MGVARSATTMARVVGPAWAGILFAQLGKEWPYYAGTVVMLVVAYFAFRSMKDNEQAKEDALARPAQDDAEPNTAPID